MEICGFPETPTSCRERFMAWVQAWLDACRRGKKVLESTRAIKMKARTLVGRGGKSLLSDPGSGLRLGKEEEKEKKKRAKIIDGMSNNNNNNNNNRTCRLHRSLSYTNLYIYASLRKKMPYRIHGHQQSAYSVRGVGGKASGGSISGFVFARAWGRSRE